MWKPMADFPKDEPVLLMLGETIPDTPDVRVGQFTSGEDAEELGYREYAKYGAWCIWNDGSDFFLIDVGEPSGWMSLPNNS